ncbi:MAG: short-chain dehydrogenase [Parvibaculum sp.]|nr:short-chain dehydrogenase [Parvibaculum sp.]
MRGRQRVRYYKGAVAIITGAASGIGKALAWELAARGTQLTLIDRQEDALSAIAAELKERGADVLHFVADVRDVEALEKIVEDTNAQFRRLDFVFNNAGIVVEGPFADHSLADWDRIIDINLKGVINGIFTALPVMQQQGFGHIVNTASLAGLIPVPRLAGYTATKHAVVGLTRVLRSEENVTGVRASVVCPGRVRTPILSGGKYGRVTSETQARLAEEGAAPRGAVEPDVFAQRMLRQIAKNKSVIIEPATVRRVASIGRHFPQLVDWMAGRMFTKLHHQN